MPTRPPQYLLPEEITDLAYVQGLEVLHTLPEVVNIAKQACDSLASHSTTQPIEGLHQDLAALLNQLQRAQDQLTPTEHIRFNMNFRFDSVFDCRAFFVKLDASGGPLARLSTMFSWPFDGAKVGRLRKEVGETKKSAEQQVLIITEARKSVFGTH